MSNLCPFCPPYDSAWGGGPEFFESSLRDHELNHILAPENVQEIIKETDKWTKEIIKFLKESIEMIEKARKETRERYPKMFEDSKVEPPRNS